jgi:hypothetical protein
MMSTLAGSSYGFIAGVEVFVWVNALLDFRFLRQTNSPRLRVVFHALDI